jgi:hypothetical protein
MRFTRKGKSLGYGWDNEEAGNRERDMTIEVK